MTIFFYGQDTYRSRQKLNELIEHYKKSHKSGLNLKYFNVKSLKLRDFEDEIQQTSMFKEKKLIILTNTFLNPEFKKYLLTKIKNLAKSDDIILFYEEGEPIQRDSLFKLLKECAKSQEFKPLEGEKLKNWLKKELANFKAKITPQALELLINYVGNDLWQLNNEIKKLVSFKAGKEIETKDIELLVKPKIESDIFKTIEAVAFKNKKQALSLIHKHLEKGDSPLYLLSMINFQFRNLLIIKDLIARNRPYYSILKTSRLHPFVVKKSWQLANKFTLPELKKIYQKIFQADLNIKTGKITSETALDLLLSEL